MHQSWIATLRFEFYNPGPFKRMLLRTQPAGAQVFGMLDGALAHPSPPLLGLSG
jgi:hypothetical protein